MNAVKLICFLPVGPVIMLTQQNSLSLILNTSTVMLQN